MNAAQILTILDTTLRVLERQEAVRLAFQRVRNDIQTMVDEGRDPTPEEWERLELRLSQSEMVLESRAEEARRLLNE